LSDHDKNTYQSKISEGSSLFEALEAIGISYLTSGLQSMREIPSDCVRFSFSNAVLEHVLRSEFEDFCRELHRVHLSKSVNAHQVDYKDHLGGQLNNLRLSHRVWENKLFPNQGYYTNRLRHREVLALFSKAQFAIEEDQMRKWDSVPPSAKKRARDFAHLNDDDLAVSGALFTARKE